MGFERSFFHWADDGIGGWLTAASTADLPTRMRVGPDRERDSDSATSDKPAAADPGGDLSTIADEGLGSISPGGSASGVIDSAGDVDYFSISLVAGQTYTISLQGTGGTPLQDPYLTLANSGGTIVAGDDDGGIGIDSLLTFTASTTGTYQIAAAAYPDSGLTGGYTVDVRQMGSDSVGSTIASAQSITVGQTTFGFLETKTDVDMFAVTLEAGSVYTIDLAGGADYDTNPSAVPKGELDTLVTIYDSAGNQVAFNDDINFPDDVSSALSFTPDASGTYYIQVDAYPRQTGGFTLEVNEIDLESLDPLDSIDWGTQLPSNNVTVYFAAAGETFDGVTSLGWSAYEIEQAMAAFQTYADVSNLTFTITDTAAGATFKLVTTNSSEFLGYFNPPGTTNAGVGVFAVNGTGWDTTGGLEQGGYGWITLVHEFGHGLGLAHPHDNGGTSTVMPGVTSPFDSYGVFDLNQGVYTTMSYNDGWQLHPSGANSGSLNYGYQGGPGAFDIALIQLKYGASSANSGDNVYVLPTANAAGAFWDVIWDTGGADSIVHNGTVAATIDLTAATLDYSPTGAGVISFVNGIYGGFTIAAGVVIENASGGTGADTIIGNSANNLLDGGAGNDTLQGRGGNDIFKYETGDGQDTITDFNAGDKLQVHGYTSVQSITQVGSDVVAVFATGHQVIFLGTTVAVVQAGIQLVDAPPAGPTEGDDTLSGTANADIIDGLGGNDVINGLGGHDQLFGSAGNDTLDGGDGNDRLDGGTGDDMMSGGVGADQYWVDSTGDTIIEFAGGGIDTVRSSIASWTLGANLEYLILAGGGVNGTGNELANTISGNSAANILSGAGGDDKLYGYAGNDQIEGGAGNDFIVGGTGIDLYVFAPADGADIVTDLESGETVEISGYTAAQSITQDGTSVIVQLSVSDRITFHNTTVAVVQAALVFPDAPPAGPTEGDDTLSGTANADIIDGLGGNDVINGLGGHDQLFGSAGNDTLDGGDGNDRLDGGTGDDAMAGGAGDDLYYVDSLGDSIIEASGEGLDTAYSSISWTLGADQEVLILTGDAVNGVGNILHNTIGGNTSANNLQGGGGQDTLFGDAGDDALFGGTGNDELYGDEGADYLHGGGGDDLLEGGAGQDLLVGSVGADSFVFGNGDFAGMTGTTADRINDFSQAEGDRIDLALVDADTLTAGDQAFQFIGSDAFSGVAGELRYEVVNTSVFVYGDTDGDGAADFMIRLAGFTAPLTSGDFVI